MAGCSVYATDTVVVLYSATCTTLEADKIKFNASLKNKLPFLNWTSFINDRIDYYEIERSDDGKNFYTIGRVENTNHETSIMTYTYTDSGSNSGKFYYRLKMVSNSETAYTRIINIEMSANKAFSILP